MAEQVCVSRLTIEKVEAEIMDVDVMLQNWARWARDRAIQGHCASIEWKYRKKLRPDMTQTGWGDWGEAPPMPILPPIDALQALAVERVMRYLPEGHRRALVLFYVARLPYKGCCKRLHLAYDRWDRYLADAQAMVLNRFTFSENRYRLSSTIRHPANAA